MRQEAWLLVLRLMASGRDFAWLYPRQDQVCFLDGHVRAFAHLGGVPRRLLYDNLQPAMARVLVGSAGADAGAGRAQTSKKSTSPRSPGS